MDVGDAATADELATLCRSCGLCCDGSLFGRARLDPDEVEGARRRGLRVVASGASFEQPCAALVASPPFACSIYADRPRACGRFTCKLYERHRREGGPLEARLAAVTRVRTLLARLDESGNQTAGESEDESRPRDGNTDPAAFEELLRRMDEDFARA
ncbi:MAG TPA: YkgJ family cysteine cluster protein [Polyangiaceae bacterium]|jgi:hypothetical protein|nr:YkgJ family cysteine cluster protein [Polyangiaceae bacterium]